MQDYSMHGKNSKIHRMETVYIFIESGIDYENDYYAKFWQIHRFWQNPRAIEFGKSDVWKAFPVIKGFLIKMFHTGKNKSKSK